jgi:glycosyltransferase involved in cell wall biosynthesis
MNGVGVCVVSTAFPRWKGDFSGPMVWNLCRSLQQIGCRVRVVTQHHKKSLAREEVEGVSITRFRYAWPDRYERIGTTSGVIDDLRGSWLAKILLPSFLLNFAKAVLRESEGCRILHVQWAPTILVALPAKLVRRMPLIVNVRTNPDTRLWRWAFKALLPLAHYVVYNSENTRQLTEAVVSHPRSTVIGSGINTRQFERPDGVASEARAPGLLRLIVVARLVEFKGIEFLIRAIQLARKELNVQLDIHGDGPLRPDLEDLIGELHLGDVVELRGETRHEQIPGELWKSDIFVLPSIVDSQGRTEGFGAVILEAMVAGVPVIVSRVGGIVDIVNESNGILVEPKDVTQLTNAIVRLGRDEQLRANLARAGKAWVMARFSEEAICAQYEAIYKTVLEEVA